MVQRFQSRTCLSISAWLVLLSACDLFAQTAGNHAKEEAAVRQAGQDYLAAVERGDSKALTDFWTAEGTYTDRTGRSVKIRDLLAKTDDQSADVHPRSKIANFTVRFLTDNVAIEEGDFNSPAVDGGLVSLGHVTALWVREGGRWKLDNVRESQIESVSGADQLASLNLFVGQWSGESNKINIHISAKWDANKQYLSRQITLSSGKATLNGTQVIGWDPRSQQIRSWMFSDDGSLSEGRWSLEDNLWMVLNSRVLPDGKLSEAMQVYKFPDKSTLVWKSLDGSVDGQPTDDFQVVLKRSTEK